MIYLRCFLIYSSFFKKTKILIILILKIKINKNNFFKKYNKKKKFMWSNKNNIKTNIKKIISIHKFR